MIQVLESHGATVPTAPGKLTSYISPSQCYTELAFDVYKMCAYSRPIMIVELCLCCVGLLNTSTIVLVFTRPPMRKSSTNYLLATMEIANFITILTRIPSSLLRIACPNVSIRSQESVLIEIANTIFKPTLFFANWMTLLIGIWRLFALTFPLRSIILCTEEKARRIIIPAAVLSVAFGVYIFIYRYSERHIYTSYDARNATCYVLPSFQNENLSKIDCMPTSYGARNAYLISCTVMSVVPCVLSIAVNTWLFVGLFVRAARRKALQEGQKGAVSFSDETRTTLVLVIYLTAHAICHGCPDLFTLVVYMRPSLSFENAGYFCFLFYNFPAFVCLSLLSLICYCLMSRKFRRTLYDMTLAKINSKVRNKLDTSQAFKPHN